MRPIYLTRQLDAADGDGIALPQQAPSAGNLALTNAAFVTNGVAYLDQQRTVGITSTGDLSSLSFVIYGTDQAGVAISETLVGPNNETVNSVLNYLTVTRIHVSGPIVPNVEVGTIDGGASQAIPMDQYISPVNITAWMNITDSVDVTLQYTGENVFAADFPSNTDVAWFDHQSLVNVTADQVGTIISPVSALRLVTNSGTGSVALVIQQAGLT